MRLAIVDDDDDVRTALFRLLRAIGHNVEVFACAEDFEASSVPVDCAIVDVHLPGSSGLELRERLRTRLAPVPVVLITGDSGRIARDSVGAIDTPLVSKPFDAAVLTAAIAEALSSAGDHRRRHAC